MQEFPNCPFTLEVVRLPKQTQEFKRYDTPSVRLDYRVEGDRITFTSAVRLDTNQEIPLTSMLAQYAISTFLSQE